jgi:two-component system chemotaxis response regulator CheY
MFIDDSSVVRRVARRILGGSGLLVIEVGTGSEAIDICAADMPEIVVVDGALPDMPSVDVIRHIRAIRSPVKPLIAICLTEVDIGAIMRARRAGAQDYILKPFNRSQLLERFRTLQAAA